MVGQDRRRGLGVLAAWPRAPSSLPAGTWVMRRGLPSRSCSPGACSPVTFYAGITYVPLMLVGQRGQSSRRPGSSSRSGRSAGPAAPWYQGHDRWAGRATALVVAGGVLLAAGLARDRAVAAVHLAPWLSPSGSSMRPAMGLGVTDDHRPRRSTLSTRRTTARRRRRSSSPTSSAAVLGIAAASAVFAARTRRAGQDDLLFGSSLARARVVAALVVVAGQRIRA